MRVFRHWLDRAARLAALGVLALALSSPVWGQCAMCRETASFQREKAVNALNRGIILLAIPPFSILLGIGWLTYRHWNAPDGQ